MLARGVGAEAVDRHHRRHTELADIGEMAGEIGKALFERGDIFLAQRIERDAAMHLQRPHGRHDHGCVRLEPGFAAFDVEEFLGAEIGAKPGLGDDVIGELQRRSSSRSPSCSHARYWRTGRHG